VNRRDFLLAGAALAGARGALPQAIAEPHFPSRLYQFVWRNWELVNADRMAEVVRADTATILKLGASMGLPRKPVLTADQLRRIYITVIRQNWHLLPAEQIVRLLGWTRERFAFTLKEDDFLGVKLGPKPDCAELLYAAPTTDEMARAAEIRRIVREVMGPLIHQPGEPRFQFVRDLSAPPQPSDAGLAREWRVAEPADATLAQAASRLRDFLIATPHGSREVRLDIDGSVAGWRVDVEEQSVRVRGSSAESVMRGVYWMQDELERRAGLPLETGITERRTVWDPRYLYSYFALYGDPLVETEIDPLPDGYIERLARAGINGVWIQAVLNTLAPSRDFPGFGAGCEGRLANLRKLVERARRFGVKIYLYLNEPRAMPEEFFRERPEMRGTASGGLYAMCTSVPAVRDWLRASLEHVMRAVPGLGGFFCITMSENHTNCFSHGGTWGVKAPVATGCPRCSRREGWETVAELIQTFRDGVRAASRSADIIAWDWGWPDELSARLIPALPRDVRFLSVSEWDQPVERGGVATRVGEYSISVTGPGPRARRNWQRAQDRGLRTMAKTQFNNSWEISAVPYLPVLPLILRHCENLAQAGISGVMPAWTCGGYPSPNLAAAMAYAEEPRRPAAEVMREMAERLYGKAAAADAIAAWTKFSEAFVEFPYGVAVYHIPTQHGPANLLRAEPTGYHASVILQPFDDLKGWCGPYPARVVEQQFAKMARIWKDGLPMLRAAASRAPRARKKFVELELAIAETCYNHFQSTSNQVEFYILRDEKGAAARARMRAIAGEEIELAKRQFALARRHSAIAYEASNHYYYTPLDLVEKILNCRMI
jgi:hypothetical protein